MSDEAIQSEEVAPEAEEESEEEQVLSVSHGHVEPERMRVWEDSLRRLCIRVDDKEHTNLRARRVFPLSGKAEYVSFLDDKGKEVALLTNPRKLDKESRQALDGCITSPRSPAWTASTRSGESPIGRWRRTAVTPRSR